jgi:hypothetical protein
MGEHECEADGIKQKSAKAGIHHAFDEHVHRLAGTAKAGFEHREADLHSEYEEGGNECPSRVDRINDVVPLQIWISRKRMPADEHGNDGHDHQHQRNADTLAGE